MTLKQWIKSGLSHSGLHGFTDQSLPTGVDWLHDINRQLAAPNSAVCLDVGANVGQTVQELRDAWPGSRIHAFEPFAQPYARLKALCQDLGSAWANPFAMGAEPGQVQATFNPQSVLSSLRAGSPPGNGQSTEQIRVDTVDRYCLNLGLEHIHVLKTDTEGYDLEVLRGAQACLSQQRITFVYTEVSFERGNQQNTPFQPVFEYLSGLDYRFLGLYETYPLHHFDSPNLFCNALFMARQRWTPTR